MLVKTILNRLEKQPGFVYGAMGLVGSGDRLGMEVAIRPRKGSRGICSGCRRRRRGYDRLPPRRFRFVPLWGVPVFFVYAMRRVECDSCGVRVEHVPWAEGKNHLTITFSWFLARWAKHMSWQEVAEIFRANWDDVFRSVEMAVEWGRAHMNLRGIRSLGIDEIQWQKGHRYLTLVYQIDEGSRRLLWIGQERTVATLTEFFRWFGEASEPGLAC